MDEANLAALGEDDRGDSSDYTDSDDSITGIVQI